MWADQMNDGNQMWRKWYFHYLADECQKKRKHNNFIALKNISIQYVIKLVSRWYLNQSLTMKGHDQAVQYIQIDVLPLRFQKFL